MSSKDQTRTTMSRAEVKFREAFSRLKRNEPIILPIGSKVSQNAVAKEAGVIPSALRASRFPDLCNEIALWIEEHKNDSIQMTTRQKILSDRKKRLSDKEKIQEMKKQRDHALSKLLSAEKHILELTMEVRRLRALTPSTAVPIRPADRDLEAIKKTRNAEK